MVDITPDIYRLYTTTPDPNMFLLLREILGVFSCSPISSPIRNGTIFTFVWSVSHLYFSIWDWIFIIFNGCSTSSGFMYWKKMKRIHWKIWENVDVFSLLIQVELTILLKYDGY